MKPEFVEQQVSRARLAARWRVLDRLLLATGSEMAGIFLIVLALIILCAPIGLGLVLVWAAYAGTVHLTGLPVAGWIAGIAVFAFLCRYVWGVRLQRAARRAAAALIAGQ